MNSVPLSGEVKERMAAVKQKKGKTNTKRERASK